jgi:hypothetical protein
MYILKTKSVQPRWGGFATLTIQGFALDNQHQTSHTGGGGGGFATRQWDRRFSHHQLQQRRLRRSATETKPVHTKPQYLDAKIHQLLEMATHTSVDSIDAMRYTQAAQNVAHCWMLLAEIKELDPDEHSL